MTDPGPLSLGLLLATLAFGLRHGIDWDHLAAITDITASQESPRRSMLFATLYALGHALVVFLLGIGAILFAGRLPANIDAFMERLVGATLVLLGAYVLYALVRDGRRFRMRSRWMLLFTALRRLAWWARRRWPRTEEIVHEHDHPLEEAHVGGEHARLPVDPGGRMLRRMHRHRHRHVGSLPEDPFVQYGRLTSLAVGMIHGVGAETPTQMVLFLTAAGVGGPLAGISLLAVFLVGLLTTNTLVAVASTYGFLGAGRSFALYAGFSVLTGAFSLIVGALFLLGRGGVLPAL